jgi:hypothetical protein
MRGDERLELADEVSPAPRPQVGVDALLEGDQAQLLEPGDLRLGELLVAEVGERGPVPEAERLAESGRGELVLPARSQRLCLPHQAFEPVQVELVAPQLEQVARRPRADPLGAERPAQAEDVHLHGLARAPRRGSGPELVDHTVAGDDLVGVQEQEREHGALPAGAERDAPVAVANLEGSEEPELHPASFPTDGNTRVGRE